MPKFEFGDDHYAALSDLLFSLRDAKAAWQAARAKPGEWDALAREIKRGHHGGAPLHTMIDETQSWAAGWWRRANARHERESPREQR